MKYTYKEFETNMEYSEEDNVFFGKIENVLDLVCFHGNTVEEFIKSFHEAVEDYIDFCKELKKDIAWK